MVGVKWRVNSGPHETYSCASSSDDCEERKYKFNNEQGYEKGYTQICAEADCNPAAARLPALALLPLAALAALAAALVH